MMRIAVLGANGFIGSRLVESLHLTGLAEVRPVMRSFSGPAQLSKFDLDSRVADARDPKALQDAFTGCQTVVCSIAGDARLISESAEVVYTAAAKAGVTRFIYLSSASVHGQAPQEGTSEDSSLHTGHVHAYNNAKVLAEQALRRQRESLGTELVILRPGIVFGPRSRWTAGLADDLLHQRAYLLIDGQGICNSIYIDNLVQAIWLSATNSQADKEAFLVSDGEVVTWYDFYLPIAEALGVDLSSIHRAQVSDIRSDPQETIRNIRSNRLVQAVLPHLPRKIKTIAKQLAFSSESAKANPWRLDRPQGPVVTREMGMLQQCRYKLPNAKAERLLGYTPPVSFREGCRRSVGWLQFAGYPVEVET